MKFSLGLLGLLIPISPLSAQNVFSMLRIDSTYRNTVNYFSETDTFALADYTAWTYDEAGRATEQRTNYGRIRLLYSSDTIYNLYEDKGPNNTWSLRSRSQKVTTGHTKIQAGENYDGKSWKNGFLQTILSDAAGRDTFYRYQEWGSAGWGAEIQARITYDECGQEIRRETYEVRFDGPRLTEQYRSEYDAAGHLVREIYLRKMGNDADRMDESIWRYGADDQLDTFQRYRYIDGHRENELLDAYAHFDKDSIVRQIFKWVDFSWQLQAKEVIFPSPRRYGLAPDSRLFYMLRSDSTFGLVMRTTYDLRELERNRLYLRKEEWQFHEETRQWNLDQLEETWYRVRDK